MKLIAIAILAIALTGCATSQRVSLGQLPGAAGPSVSTVAFAPEKGNSANMDKLLRQGLAERGVSGGAVLPSGTRADPRVDAIVAYRDVWRWDIVMYLKSLEIEMFDARTGRLLVNGRWKNSSVHQFADAKTVVDGLLTEMLEKTRSAGFTGTLEPSKVQADAP